MTRAKGKRVNQADSEVAMERRPDLDHRVISHSLMNRSLVRERRAETLRLADKKKTQPLTVEERTARWESYEDVIDPNLPLTAVPEDDEWEDFS